VTLHLVIPAGTVQVVEDVKTCMVVKPPAGAVDAQVVPLEVRTFPDVLGAITCKADAPLPSKTLFAVKVAAPVPPLATGKVPVTLVVKLANVVDVVPVPPLAIGSVPVTPVVKGSPVKLVAVPLEGVPSAPLGAT
jgi:hypothetical protein